MVENPVVELDGDEMTRIIWKKIREEVSTSCTDLSEKYFDTDIVYVACS